MDASQILRATRAVVLIEAARHVEGDRVIRSGFAYEFDMPRLVETRMLDDDMSLDAFHHPGLLLSITSDPGRWRMWAVPDLDFYEQTADAPGLPAGQQAIEP